jgi:hypothetical protein
MTIYYFNPSLKYYVYAYLRDDSTPYYIGKGTAMRAWNKTAHYVKPPRNPNNIVILEKSLTELGALALERRMIRWYGRIDNDTGILRNMTDGGDGVYGRKVSPDTVKKALDTKRKTGGIYACASPASRAQATITRLKNNNGTYNTQTAESKAKGKETKLKNKSMPNKIWRITSPVGIEYTVSDLKEFCSKNKLSYDTLRRYINCTVPAPFRKVKHRETINSTGWSLHTI